MSTQTDELAINGGHQAVDHPLGTGKRFADNELKYLQEALEQNTLFYGFGEMVKRACDAMQRYTAMPHVVACSSGTAALHLGLIACGIGPGDEVIVTPNTDSGSVIGIMEEGAVPIFCDPEWTLQPSVRGVEEKLTDRTRAVMVVHLAGAPAPVDEIVEFCHARGLGVVEDCAQSWGAKLSGQLVGTFSDAGCYSINDFKHISAGDGGFVAVRDEAAYRRVSNYSDKHYDRLFDQAQRQAHHAVNYRMTELQGAVALAQLEKVDKITSRCHELGERLREQTADLPGAKMVETVDGGYSTYWWTVYFIDKEKLSATRDALVEALQAEGVPAGGYGGYDLIGKPLFQARNARPWLDDERRYYPFTQPDGREYHYSHDQTPRHRRMLETGIMLSLNTFWTDRDIDDIARGLNKVFAAYAR